MYRCECDNLVSYCTRTTPWKEWEQFRDSLTDMRGFIVRKDCPNHPSSHYTILQEEGNLALVIHNEDYHG